MSTPKPHVQIACVCEKVLIEPDRVPSLIRIVDTFTMAEKPQLPPGFTLQTDLTAFVALKSGDVRGQFEVALKLTRPDGTSYPVNKWPVDFRGDEAGVNIRIGFQLRDPKIGLYWFDVLWGEDVLTRIPFRLKASGPSESSQSEEAKQ